VPGIWSKEQVEGWKQVTKAVHDKGGRIFMQIWHVGRVSDRRSTERRTPVGPSAIAAKGHVSLLRPERPYPTPRALTTEEVAGVVEAFRKGAQNAKDAGFDGVRSTAPTAICSTSSCRTAPTSAPTSTAARSRTAPACCWKSTDAAISVFGAGRVGVHLAPRADSHSMGDSDLAATFGYVAKELGERGIAFISPASMRPRQPGPGAEGRVRRRLHRQREVHRDSANAAIEAGKADAVAFGKAYIANPDLVERLQLGAPLNAPDPSTFYGGDGKGYTDYPTLAQVSVPAE
jgi:2,4-dienoyl-CoA reductase-like NADH-dependent reductase (Old Yellow Enzyme family)